MPEFDAVLVYDGDCPLCSAAATAMRRLPEVGTVAWNDDAVRALLRAQFGGVPFALVFVDVEAERSTSAGKPPANCANVRACRSSSATLSGTTTRPSRMPFGRPAASTAIRTLTTT